MERFSNFRAILKIHTTHQNEINENKNTKGIRTEKQTLLYERGLSQSLFNTINKNNQVHDSSNQCFLFIPQTILGYELIHHYHYHVVIHSIFKQNQHYKQNQTLYNTNRYCNW